MSKPEKISTSSNKLFITLQNAAIKTGWSLKSFYRLYPADRIFRIGRCDYCLIPEVEEWAEKNINNRHKIDVDMLMHK